MSPERRPLVAGNWKMNGTSEEAVSLVRELIEGAGSGPACEVLLCPPFTALGEVALLLAGSPWELGAQNLHTEPRGAFTGEISAPMLRSVGCRYVLVGHSERRTAFGEDDAAVAGKAAAARAEGLVPIVCVGESLADREGGRAERVVDAQLEAGVLPLPLERPGAELVVVYEPVWAIGTGCPATPEQAQAVHARIRARLGEHWGEAGRAVRILYGGSVTPENAAALLSEPDLDGALVGGASLRADTFLAIVQAADAARERH